MRRGTPSSLFASVVVALVFLLVVSTVPAAGSPAAAPTGAWTDIGPQGAAINGLGVDPTNGSVVYATIEAFGAAPTDPRVYRSADGGLTWTAASTGLPTEQNVQLSQVVVAPSTPATLYVVDRWVDRLFRSQNAGTSWTRIDSGPVETGVVSFAVDPTNANVVYAGTPTTVYKSTDGGGTWNPAGAGLPGTEVRRLAIVPTAPSTVYALAGTTLYRTVDGGESWSLVNPTLDVSTLFVDASAPTTLYAASYGFATGLQRSIDGGTTFVPINTGLTPENVTAFTADLNVSGLLYAASVTQLGTTFVVHRSDNGGTSWTPVFTGLTAPRSLASGGGRAYLGTGHGVYHSSNGTSWTFGGRGLPRLPVLSVLAGQPESTLYVGVRDSGVWRSTDRGDTWVPPNETLTVLSPTALAQQGSNVNVLYAATFDFGTLRRSGVQKSTDGGTTWAPTALQTVVVNIAESAPYYNTLAVDPQSGATVMAGGYLTMRVGAGSTSIGHLVISRDGGASWPETPGGGGFAGGQITSILFAGASPTTAYASSILGAIGHSPATTTLGVSKTTDGGATWSPTGPLPTSRGARSLAIDPSSPFTLYAGLNGSSSEVAVVKSTNGGDTWVPASAGLTAQGGPTVGALQIDPFAPTTVYAGLNPGGVFKSTNGGQNWGPVQANGSPNTIVALQLDRLQSAILYAIDGNRLVALDQGQLPVTPIPTPTITPTQGPGPVCNPRPQVRLLTNPANGALSVRVLVAGSQNTLKSVAFGAAQNGLIDLPPTIVNSTGNVTYTAPNGAVEVTFTLRRAQAGQPTHLPFTVVDGCGEWRTFVGGGPGAGF